MKDKVVIITGGSSGIGLALAEKFGSEGSKIVITGRNAQNLQKAAELLQTKGIQILAIQADSTIMADNQRMVEETIRRFGAIDVLVANAGISMRAYFEDTDMEVIRKVLETNFFGAVNSIKVCLPHLLKTRGYVIGISSVAGLRGLPGRTGYCASKFALHGFLESLRTEMLGRGVTVMTVSPGYVASNIRATALLADGSAQGYSPRNEANMMSAEQCARIIYRAALRRKKIVTLTLKDKITILLNKFFPVLMDKIVFKAIASEEGSIVKPLK